MAGDWIKIRTTLCDDPDVFGISAKLDIDHDLVVGKLLRIWAWADQHTTDGHAEHMTFRQLDYLIGQPGFAEAMQEVGWLELKEDGVSFTNFNRHNGQSAKRRAEENKRRKSAAKTPANPPQDCSTVAEELQHDCGRPNPEHVAKVRAEEADREAQKVEAEKRSNWSRLKRLIGPRYADCTLGSFEVSEPKQRAVLNSVREYCEDMIQTSRAIDSMILFGPCGTGKDHLLTAMLRVAVLKVGLSAEWIDGLELFGKLRDGIGSESTEAQQLRE